MAQEVERADESKEATRPRSDSTSEPDLERQKHTNPEASNAEERGQEDEDNIPEVTEEAPEESGGVGDSEGRPRGLSEEEPEQRRARVMYVRIQKETLLNLIQERGRAESEESDAQERSIRGSWADLASEEEE